MAKYFVRWAYMRNPIKPIGQSMPFDTEEDAEKWKQYHQIPSLNYWIDRVKD